MSCDDTRSILQRIATTEPGLRILENAQLTAPAGLNAALGIARGDVIVRMDAHTEYAPDYVVRCVEVLRKTGADNVGGPARTDAESYVQRAAAAAYHSRFSVGGARFHDENYEGFVDTIPYGCWRKETFRKFGFFDVELARNQDDEHNLRIIRGGGRIYQSPTIKSWYKPRSSLTTLFKQYMQYGYWKVRVIQKHKLPASWRHLVPATFVLALALLFLLSAFCFLLLSPSHFSFQLSAFSFLFAVFGYTFSLAVASIITAAKTEWSLLPILPFVFLCYHLGYGFGFLRGFWDFIVLRRGANQLFTRLTR
jgi:glycosyltransferase involved in cell wall biosynthesis